MLLRLAMVSTDRNWRRWGAEDPYYGVVSHPQFSGRNIDQNRNLFFNSGEEFIARVLAKADRCFAGVRKNGFALDFGCGVARLTVPLARRFSHVDGLDVSPGMLEEARKNCKAFGLGNVQFYLSNGDFEHWPRQYDFVNSYIVLQHIPLRRGYTIIGKLLDHVAIGGIAMLHVSLRRRLSPARAAAYQVRHKFPFAGYALNLLQGRHLFAPQMQMNEYDLVRVLDIFRRNKMNEVAITFENHRSVETAMIMGRKQAVRTCAEDRPSFD